MVTTGVPKAGGAGETEARLRAAMRTLAGTEKTTVADLEREFQEREAEMAEARRVLDAAYTAENVHALGRVLIRLGHSTLCLAHAMRHQEPK